MRAFFPLLARAVDRICGRARSAGSGQAVKRRRVALESLEPRFALDGAAPSFAPIGEPTVLGGTPLWLGIDGSDLDGGSLTYSVSVSNPSLLEAAISPRANSSLRMDVAGYGQLTFHLFDHLAPKTTQHIKELVGRGDFDNSANLPVKWYRIAHYGDNTEFVIQAGPEYPGGSSSLGKFDDEYHLDLQYTSAGLLAMAKSTDDTNDAHIFVSGSPARFLDFNHAIFGVLTEGEAVRHAIQRARLTGDGPPPSDIIISSSTIFADNQNAALQLKAAEGASGQSDVTLSVTDAEGNTFSRTFRVTIAPDTANSAPFLSAYPSTITAAPGQPVTIQLHAFDAENHPSFFDAVKPLDETVPYTLTVNNTTGLVTIAPPAGFIGSFRVQVGVRGATQATTADQFDTQIIEVVIGTPGLSVDLLAESDTGSSSTDNITNASSLQFRVSGVTDGALVKLNIGSTILAQGTASGSSITLSTTEFAHVGVALLLITATQTIEGVESDPTPPLSLVFDSLAPQFTGTISSIPSVGVPFSSNVQTSEEGSLGLRYSLTGPFGASIDPLTGVISWTPSPAQAGPQVLVVTATDAAGNQSSQQLSFSVATSNLPNNPPIAVNDTAVAYGDVHTGGVIINVLANDISAPDVGETLTIVAVTQPASGGIAQNTGYLGIHYAAPPGFVGIDTFTYTISDGRGGTATATVTVVVHAPPTTIPQVGLIIELTTPGGLPLTGLVPGQEFVLHVRAKDQSLLPRGVFAAFLDVSWDSALAVATGPIQFAGTYPNGHSGSASTPGLIDEGGAFASTAELGNGAFEVFSIPMRAIAAGALVFTANPADQLPVHEVLVFGRNERVPAASIQYGTATVTISDFSSLDVNLDGSIAPSDALMVINAINDQLALGIENGSLPQSSEAGRLDISKDRHLTAIDALIVVNRLNEPLLIVVDPPYIIRPPYIISPPCLIQPLYLLPVNDPLPVLTTDAEGESAATLADQALLALQTDEIWLDLAAPRHLRSRH